MKYLATLVVLVLLGFSSMQAAEVRSNAGGRAAVWSLGTTWTTGAVPGPADVVTITDGDTITIDMDATIAGLTVGTSTGGVFQFPKTAKVALTVNGNILVLPGSTFKAQTSNTGVGELIHSVTLTGNFTSTGASTMDVRVGSAGSTMGVVNFILTGSTNTVFTTNPLYNSSTNELNGMTVNKSGSGKVILGSNITFAGGSSTSVASTSILNLTNGVIETGGNILIHNSTTGANIAGASSKSYILGALARGMSSGGGSSKDFPVGDAGGYRPIKIRSTSPGSVTGHYVVARVVKANANTGSSVLNGGIDKVSGVRYYEIKYGADVVGAPTTMSFDKFTPTYGTDDGVGVGNTDLRVAYSTDKRATWIGLGQSVKDTTFVTDTVATADSLVAPGLTIDSTQAIYVAIARATVTTTNTLVSSGTAVKQESALPQSFSLEQNYPNPFNPSTTMKFAIANAAQVRLTVYDLLGRTVATVVHQFMQAGKYSVQWNAASIPSGVYLYRLEAGSFSSVKKLTLMK
jgi:hypothetical protein